MERWFMQSVGKKWSGWKAEAKRIGYTPYNDDPDRLAHRPNRVIEQQWRCLVYYWGIREVAVYKHHYDCEIFMYVKNPT